MSTSPESPLPYHYRSKQAFLASLPPWRRLLAKLNWHPTVDKKVEMYAIEQRTKQIKIEIEKIKNETEQIKNETEQIKNETARLRSENEQVRNERAQRRKEDERMRKEDERLRKEDARMRKEDARLAAIDAKIDVLLHSLNSSSTQAPIAKEHSGN